MYLYPYSFSIQSYNLNGPISYDHTDIRDCWWPNVNKYLCIFLLVISHRWAEEKPSSSLSEMEASCFLLTWSFETGDAAGEPVGQFWDVLSSPWEVGDRHAVEGELEAPFCVAWQDGACSMLFSSSVTWSASLLAPGKKSVSLFGLITQGWKSL